VYAERNPGRDVLRAEIVGCCAIHRGHTPPKRGSSSRELVASVPVHRAASGREVEWSRPDVAALLIGLAGESLTCALMVLDEAGQALAATSPWTRLTGLEASRSAGHDWLQAFAPQDRDHAMAATRGRASPCELVLASVSGRRLRLRIEPLSRDLGRGGGSVVVVDDVTEQHPSDPLLADASVRDPRTGLVHRSYFLELVGLALRRQERGAATLALVLVDLRPLLAPVRRAPERGDGVVAAVVGRLRSVARPGDTIGHLGPDDLALLCEDLASFDDAVRLVEQVLAVADAGQNALRAGVAFPHFPDQTVDGLVHRAEQALQLALTGRRRFEVSLGATQALAGSGTRSGR
jgi:GGDEF domain-containing protein